jgi:hypothetical protein
MTQLHNRGHTSVPPCYYEKDRVFIMSKNFVGTLSIYANMRCGMGCDCAVFVIPAAHFLFVG